MRRYECLYRGGKKFRSNIMSFLPRQRTDDDLVYGEKCKAASYRSYVGPIVDFYAAQLFSAPYNVRPVDAEGQPIRTADPFYADFREDCDGQGTDLTSFLKAKFVEALVKGKSYVLVEMPRPEDIEPENLQDWRDRGLDRARLRCVTTECVLDWEVDDETGDYAWLVTHDCQYRRTVLGAPVQEVHTWRHYTTEDVTVYRRVYADNECMRPEDEVPRVDQYPHGFPRVPIVPLCLPEGLWLLDRCADAQIEHFLLSAALGWSLRRSAYAMGIFKLKDSDQQPKTGAGLGIFLGTEEEFAWAEPQGNSHAVLQSEISAQKDEIHRVSSQMAMAVDNNAAGLGRSGLSKMADSAATEICLRGYSVVVKECLEKLFELISDARGDYDTKFSVEGLNQFTLIDATTLILNAKTAKELAIPSETFEKELNYRVAEALLPSDCSQSVKDRIRDEIMSGEADEDPEEEMGPESGANVVPKPRTLPMGTPPMGEE